jgi:hypothetical protein
MYRVKEFINEKRHVASVEAEISNMPLRRIDFTEVISGSP